MNKKVPLRTKKEWCEDNKEIIRDKGKLYYEDNKDKIAEYQKENKDAIKEKHKIYYEKNKAKFLERAKEYRENNREKINEKQRIKKSKNII